MVGQSAPNSDPRAQSILSCLQDLLGNYHPRDFAVRLWDNTIWNPEPGQPARCTVVLKQPNVLSTIGWPLDELRLGEAYLADAWDLEGEGEALLPLAEHLLRLTQREGEQSRYQQILASFTSQEPSHFNGKAAHLYGALHSPERDRQAIFYHYDVSNEFYALWLDRRMVYSCAYFVTPEDNLDSAQEQKLDYICRKLRLRSGQRLLDIGCGWGGLVMHAAQHYGVEAFGITLSQRQAEWANAQIQATGLSQHCRVEVCDYRDIGESERYDALASVGMVEHVGEAQLPIYFARAWDLLRPGGVFLNHGIACPPSYSEQSGPSFVDHYLFPDAEIVPINTMLHAAEVSGFEVRDVESLREHYALTTRHWLRRLEAHQEDIRRLTNEVTYRVWRISALGAIQRFLTGRQNVYQVLLVKSHHGYSGLPLTRADWYVS